MEFLRLGELKSARHDVTPPAWGFGGKGKSIPPCHSFFFLQAQTKGLFNYASQSRPISLFALLSSSAAAEVCFPPLALQPLRLRRRLQNVFCVGE